MPFPLALLLPLALQVGPSGTQMQAPLDMPRKPPARRAVAPPPRVAAAQGRLAACLTLAHDQPDEAIAEAETWRAGLTGTARAEPEQCLGLALIQRNRWAEAEAAFRESRDDTPASDRAQKARRGAMAGNAGLVAGSPARALAALDLAHGEALGAADAPLAGQIAIDRARALVALKREAEAAEALAEARHNVPGEAQAWLLSATLARRQDKLAEAQVEIAHAATLAPLDPENGLEAGVIAVLSGHTEAARKSWLSVIAAAAGSEQAKTAQRYLDQLGSIVAPPAK